jgi:ketosteroid isomerase-like protein
VRSALLAVVLLAACPAPRSPAPAPNAELSRATQPYAWMLGDWKLDQFESFKNGVAEKPGPTGSTEHWVAAGGTIYGIALTGGDFFEVMVVDRENDSLYLWAMPGGAKSVRFLGQRPATNVMGFANPEHDFPKSIGYRVAGDRIAAELEGVEEGTQMRQLFRFSRTTGAPAPELEAADVAFAKDVAARGIDGWIAAFEPEGGMISIAQGKRVEGHDAIAELMRELLAKGKLAWAPIASRVRGKVGFTVGKATYTGATPAESWQGTYVTIWRKQADGSWKVLFDTGRPAHED